MLETAFAGLGLGSATRPGFFGQRLSVPQILQRRAPQPLQIEAAHKKGGGSTKNGRDSNSQRRGVKVYGGQAVRAGGIIIRQLGTAVHPGPGVGLGKDYTLYALQEGIVVFKRNKYIKRVTVVPFADYVRPEGQQRKEGSRKMRRKQLYSPRNTENSAAVGVATVAAL